MAQETDFRTKGSNTKNLVVFLCFPLQLTNHPTYIAFTSELTLHIHLLITSQTFISVIGNIDLIS